MPGLKWHQPNRSYFGPNYYVTYNKDEIEEFQRVVEQDIRDCRICQGRKGMMPKHMTAYAVPDGVPGGYPPYAATYHCESFSRWFNPQTKEMEGSEHCACSACF